MKTGERPNEHGAMTSSHVCDTCGEPFTVTPAVDNDGWENCMDPNCASYDPDRDADRLFAADSPVIKLDAYRQHRMLEVICVKCCKRWAAVERVETPLVKYECENCGPGYVVSTGWAEIAPPATC